MFYNNDNKFPKETEQPGRERVIDLKTFLDERWNLTVVENIGNPIPFDIKRLFYIYNVDYSERGKHRHKITRQVAICLSGACTIDVNDEDRVVTSYRLDKPSIGLLLEPKDFHTMKDFTKDAILMVFASELYTPDDYIYENYPAWTTQTE